MLTPALIVTTTKRQRPWIQLTVAFLIALILGACSTTGDKMDDLNKALRGYEKAIRWGKYDAAYSFHKWPDGIQPSLPANMDNIRVTSYETVGEKFNEKEMIMKQTIKLRYYNTENLREKAMQLPQEWKFFPELKRWYLISDPITFQ